MLRPNLMEEQVGELQRLSTEAEMLPLMRTGHGLVLSQEGRQLQVALRRAVADGVEKKALIAIATDVAMDAMDSVKRVDNHRKTLAGSDHGLNAALAEIELSHIDHVNRIQRGSAF